MKEEKSPRMTFQWTVITVLSLVACYLAHDFHREHTLLAVTNSAVSGVSAPSVILEQTIKRMENLRSITAKIDMQVRIGEISTEGNGKYEELFLRSGDNQQHNRILCYGGMSLFRLHLELTRSSEVLSENNEDNILDIVCDKNTLWTYTSIEGDKKLTELKLGEMAAILVQANENNLINDSLAMGQVSLPCPLNGFPGLGGITGMLRRLITCYDFGKEAEPVSMKGKTGTFHAWKLTGQLKPEIYKKSVQNLLSVNAEDRKKQIGQFPSLVEVYISQQYEFPYRLCYYSVPETNTKKKKRLVTLDITDVYEDHFSVIPENFIYSPGGLASTDITRSYIEKLIPEIDF